MKTSSFLALTATLGLATTASAQVLMLDFGPTTAAGDDRLNSPYHANSSSLHTGWNTIGVADVTSGLKYADGKDAAGVEVHLGYSTTTTIDLATNPGSGTQLTGSAILSTSGVYANSSPARDGIFQNTAGANLGVQISGLDAGTYDIYVVARNTNSGTTTNSGQTQTVLAGKQSTAGNFDFSSTINYSSGTLSYPVNQSTSLYTSEWVEGENYIKLSISLTAGEFLNIAVDGNSVGASTDARAFLNSIQIVNTSPIPEPSAFAALAGLAGLGLAATRRRRA